MRRNPRLIFFTFLLLFSLFFLGRKHCGAFYRFSMEQMERFFLSSEVREVFGVDDGEAEQVFGADGKAVYL